MTATAILDDLLIDLSPDQRETFKSDYAAISGLTVGSEPVQQFLDEYLRHTVSLYAATAGVIWFRAPDAEALSAKARIGFDRLGLVGELAAAHEKLLQYSLDRPKSVIVKPYSAPAPKSGVSNPTDSFLILGPIRNGNDALGLVELFLGPTPTRGRTATDRQRYALWLDHLVSFLSRGIENRFKSVSTPFSVALSGLQAVRQQVEGHQKAIREALERTLQQFAGWSFGSLENNQSFTTQVHELLDSLGLRVVCPECRAPAILRCQPAGNAKTGAFLYDHTLPTGRTFHGGPTTFPRLTLTSKAPRKSARSKANPSQS